MYLWRARIFIAQLIGVDLRGAHGLVIFALIDGVILGLNENIHVYEQLRTRSDLSAIPIEIEELTVILAEVESYPT